MKPENHDYREDDRLWELLGNSREPRVSADFTDKVLRAIRQENAVETPVSEPKILLFRWWPAVAAAAAALTLFFALRPAPVTPGTLSHATTASSTQAAVATVEDFQEDPLYLAATAEHLVQEPAAESYSAYETLATTNDLLLAEEAPDLDADALALLIY